jgi:hypothetical protein
MSPLTPEVNLMPANIRVIVIEPGATATELPDHTSRRQQAGFGGGPRLVHPAARHCRRHRLRRQPPAARDAQRDPRASHRAGNVSGDVAKEPRRSAPHGRTSARAHRQRRQQRMEPLWSPVVATRGNQRQMERRPKRRKQAKTVAVGCHRLPQTFHGKEGVDGSSPSEGFQEVPANQTVSLSQL